MKRILIVGCPGAGKSYLSREIAKITGLPLIHLDKYFHQKAQYYIQNKDAWRAKIKELTSEPEWIIEGNYGSTMYERMKVADLIIFLDYPTRIAVGRVLKRRIQYNRKRREDMPSDWKEKIAPDFFKFVITFRKTQRPRILKYLDELGKESVILRSPNETKSFLKELAHDSLL